VNPERLLSLANRWFSTSVGLTLVIFLSSAICGFLLLPYADADSRFSGIWDAICNAAGFPVKSSATDIIQPEFKISGATLGLAELTSPSPQSIGRGATLAQQCAICHGPEGVSRADAPNLAGQYAQVIYKQLHDFRSGARTNATMGPFAAHMNDRDMIDLAAYYAYLPRIPSSRGSSEVPLIVASGAPTRGIAPCGSCHGTIERKIGSPWLNGQPAAYIEAQLRYFASGARRNDTNQQMRNIARALTDDEIKAVASYYAGTQ